MDQDGTLPRKEAACAIITALQGAVPASGATLLEL